MTFATANVGTLLAVKIHGKRTKNSAASRHAGWARSNDFISAGPSLGKAGNPARFGLGTDEDDDIDAGHCWSGVLRVFMTQMVRSPSNCVL
jgi:hypothetical protein